MKTASVKKRYKETSKLINGYNQSHSMERALGFNEPYDLQCRLSGYSHLINASDIVTVCNWLIDKGYDIIVPPELNKDLKNG